MPRAPRGGEAAIRRGFEFLDRGYTFTQAALAAGCDRYTLSCRYKGERVSHSEQIYQMTLLSAMQERVLVEWIILVDEWGFPASYKLIEEKALVLVREANPEIQHLGEHWVQRFIKRHKDQLKSLMSTQLDQERASASKRQKVLRDFFSIWQNVIQRFNILPKDIYNFDEKGCIIGQTSREWCVVSRDKSTPYAIRDGNRESVTVIECIRAGIPSILKGEELYRHPGSAPYTYNGNQHNSHAIPPVFITSGQHYTAGNFRFLLDKEGGANILAGAIFHKSPNGYTSNKFCRWWIEHHFDKHTRANAAGRPRLIVLDGHGSHITLEIIEYCMANNIHLVCLPAHSTAFLQPLDVAVFRPLQRAYGKLSSAWTQNPTTGRMSLAAFFLLYHRAREEAIILGNIQAGFEATGLLPIDMPRIFAKLKLPLSDSDETTPLFTEIPDFNIAKVTSDLPPPTPKQEKSIRHIVDAARKLQSSARDLTYTHTHGSRSSDIFSLNASLSTTTFQMSSLLDLSSRAAQRAMAERDLYRTDLLKLRQQIKGKPEEAVIDSRRRDYGELLTTEDVLRKRKEEAEKLLQTQMEKEQRAIEKEGRRLEKQKEQMDKEERMRERENARLLKLERERLEKEEKAKEKERKRQEAEEKKLQAEANRQLLTEQTKDKPRRYSRKPKTNTPVAVSPSVSLPVSTHPPLSAPSCQPAPPRVAATLPPNAQVPGSRHSKPLVQPSEPAVRHTRSRPVQSYPTPEPLVADLNDAVAKMTVSDSIDVVEDKIDERRFEQQRTRSGRVVREQVWKRRGM